MALFLDRRSGLPTTSKLKEVFPPLCPHSECPIYVLDDSDTDDSSTVYDSDIDDVFTDALSHLPDPREPIRLPEEVLDEVMRKTQEEAEDPTVLRVLSLSLNLSSHEAVKRLRTVIDAGPELARAVKSFDLSSPGTAWQDGRVGEIFRRAGGLLRQTPNVKEVRTKLFGALEALPLRKAHFYSSSWTHFGRNGARRSPGGGTPDIAELAHLLCVSNRLETLTLSGYSSYPRLLSSHVCPSHTMPTYRLTDLTIISADLSNSTLLWLLGLSSTSLKRLNLAAVTGLTKEVLSHLFTLVGPSLEILLLSLDIDDLHPSSSSDSLDNSILAPLKALQSFNLSTDTVFLDTVLQTLVTLPELRIISLCFPSFGCEVVKRAIEIVPVSTRDEEKSNDWEGLRRLTLDAWETSTMWEETERWEVLQACEKRGVELSLNGLMKEDIEEGA
ncbi:hypothetical protein JCM11641_007179 [Rhodosporidiobolus odoratus]